MTTSKSNSPALRVLQGGLSDDSKAFARAYHAAMIARAERELIEARWVADHFLSPVGHYSPLWEQRGPALDRMRAAVFRCARVPAASNAELAQKIAAIGRVWLNAEGDIYDDLRAFVAADKARLADIDARNPRKQGRA